MTEEEFAPPKYPGSCNGPCYFISREANDKLVDESFKQAEFKLEDMYVTGILRDEQSIPIFAIPRGNMLCQHLGKKSIMHSNVEYIEATGKLTNHLYRSSGKGRLFELYYHCS